MRHVFTCPHCQVFFFEIKIIIFHASVSTVARSLNEHDRDRTASQTKREQRNEWQVRLRLHGYVEFMEQQVAALIQQVMEMSERLKQRKETAEQAEERMNRAETTATAVTGPGAGGIGSW